MTFVGSSWLLRWHFGMTKGQTCPSSWIGLAWRSTNV